MGRLCFMAVEAEYMGLRPQQAYEKMRTTNLTKTCGYDVDLLEI